MKTHTHTNWTKAVWINAVWLATCFLLTAPAFTRDVIVQFEAENYRETSASFSYTPVVYHSIQVSTPAGSKLLVLVGDDFQYRKWLRQYIARDKAFVIKVPEEQDDLFVSSDVFDIDVTQVHPLDFDLYKKGDRVNANTR